MQPDPYLWLKRLGQWTLVCGISAAPSFIWARGFDPGGMIVGVFCFILAYTVGTSTAAFQRFQRHRGVRSALRVVYGTRLAMSILFPVGMAVDLFPGMLAIQIVTGHVDPESSSFSATLAITILQGIFLNVLLGLYGMPVYAIAQAVQKGKPGNNRCLCCAYDVRGLAGDCPTCGTPIEAPLCPMCNYDLRATVERCPECGTPVPAGHRPSVTSAQAMPGGNMSP